MSNRSANSPDQYIHCPVCGKIICQGFIEIGVIKLQCRCGVKTTIEAKPKSEPEGRKPREVIVIPMDKATARTATGK